MTCEKTDTESARADAQNTIEEPERCMKNAANHQCGVRERLAQQERQRSAREQQDAMWKGWRDYPPVVAEVSACEWWWYRQRGKVDYTAPQVLRLLVDARVGTGVCVWDGDGSVRPFSIEEYGDGAEFLPCLPIATQALQVERDSALARVRELVDQRDNDRPPQLTDAQREALAYVRDLVSRNLISGSQDAVSKRHTAMVRAAVECIDGMVAK